MHRAVDAYYNDEQLRGFTIDSDDGQTLLVPAISLPRLNKLEIPHERV